MGSLCADHHHHHQLPPRKQLLSGGNPDSPAAAYDPDSDPYSSDDFRMYEFKIRRCTRSRSHDWTDCPFAHPGEKARRRDPRKHPYSAAVCPDFRRAGACPRADDCQFAHGVFEVWLHPARYRTEACKDGKNCKRKVCFFAHSPRQLRVLPADSDPEGQNGHFTSSCKYCTCSPRSTLAAPLSPPSPSPASARFAWADHQPVFPPLDEQLAYEEALGELMISSLEAMSLKDTPLRRSSGGLWVDVLADRGGDEQYALSPSSSMGAYWTGCSVTGAGGGYSFDSPCSRTSSGVSSYSFGSPASSCYKSGGVNLEAEMNMKVSVDVNGGSGDPDLGWVNDLLM